MQNLKKKDKYIKSCCTKDNRVYKKVKMKNGEIHIAIKCSGCDKFFAWARRTTRTMRLSGIKGMEQTIPITRTEQRRRALAPTN